jgi:hypothetical protein
MSDKTLFWQLAVVDGDEPWFREGTGFAALETAMKDVMGWTEERTPDGFIPSGNLSLYWHVGAKVRAGR